MAKSTIDSDDTRFSNLRDTMQHNRILVTHTLKAHTDQSIATAEKFRAEGGSKEQKKYESDTQDTETENDLENHCVMMRGALNEETLKEKFEGDQEKTEDATQETLDWLGKTS